VAAERGMDNVAVAHGLEALWFVASATAWKSVRCVGSTGVSTRTPKQGPLAAQLQRHDPVDEDVDGFHIWHSALAMSWLPVAP
jgi:hypothetical protein